MKDQVHVLDKTGAVYYNKCKRHIKPKNDYVGETDRVWRGRQYEHGVVDHKTATRSASINHAEDHPEHQNETKVPLLSGRLVLFLVFNSIIQFPVKRCSI